MDTKEKAYIIEELNKMIGGKRINDKSILSLHHKYNKDNKTWELILLLDGKSVI